MSYDYLNQSVMATELILPKDCDSFYNPQTQGHNGYAADGYYYSYGVAQNIPQASWFTEPPGDYRGNSQPFPSSGLVLLSKAALTILDESTPSLSMWAEFLLSDTYALTNNYNSTLQGYTPSSLSYANGKISVTYEPDSGATGAKSIMVVTIDFTQDKVYLDVSA